MQSIRACVVQATSTLVSMASTTTQTAITKVSSLWRKPERLNTLEIRRQGEWVRTSCCQLRKGNRVRELTDGRFLCMLRFEHKQKNGAYLFTIMTDDGRYEYPWEQHL